MSWPGTTTEPAARRRSAGYRLADLGTADWTGLSALVFRPASRTHPEPHPVAGARRAAGVRSSAISSCSAAACRRRAMSASPAPTANRRRPRSSAISWARPGATVEVGGNLGTPALSLTPLGRDGIYVLEIVLLSARADADVAASTSRCCSTSRPIISTATAAWRAMSPPRSASSTGRDQACMAAAAVMTTRRRLLRDAMYCTAPRREARASSPCRRARIWNRACLSTARACCMTSWGRDPSRAASTSARPSRPSPGRHNWQNAAAAMARGARLRIGRARYREGVCRQLSRPAHRLQLVATIHGVRFINDSKATNADATSRRAGALHERIYWIAGGKRAKEGGIDIARVLFRQYRTRLPDRRGGGAIRRRRWKSKSCRYTRCGTLEVRRARGGAKGGQ